MECWHFSHCMDASSHLNACSLRSRKGNMLAGKISGLLQAVWTSAGPEWAFFCLVMLQVFAQHYLIAFLLVQVSQTTMLLGEGAVVEVGVVGIILDDFCAATLVVEAPEAETAENVFQERNGTSCATLLVAEGALVEGA